MTTTATTNSAKTPFGTDRAGTFSNIGYWSALARCGCIRLRLGEMINIVFAPSAVNTRGFIRDVVQVATNL